MPSPEKKRSKTDFIVTKLKVNETVSDKTNPALLKWFILRRKDRFFSTRTGHYLSPGVGGGGGGEDLGLNMVKFNNLTVDGNPIETLASLKRRMITKTGSRE